MGTWLLYNFVSVKFLLKIAIVVTVVAACLHGEPVSSLRPSNYVNDFAGVLDASTQAQMNDLCKQVEEKAKAQVTVVTVHTLDGVDVESYAVDLFKKWGIGDKTTNRGVLILYAIQDRRARVEVGYGLEPILPDGKVGSFQREAAPLMQGGDYSKALLLVTSRVASVIAQDAGVEITGVPAPAIRTHAAPQRGMSPGTALLIVIVVVIVLVTPPLRRLLFWILLSQMVVVVGAAEAVVVADLEVVGASVASAEEVLVAGAQVAVGS